MQLASTCLDFRTVSFHLDDSSEFERFYLEQNVLLLFNQ